MKIIVKPLSEREFELEVNPEGDVEHLKQLIERRCNIGVTQQRLVHLGKTLSDGSSLASSKLSDGSRVHLFTKKQEEGPKRSQLDMALINTLKNHVAKDELERFLLEFNKELQNAFTSYSLEDIDRLAASLSR